MSHPNVHKAPRQSQLSKTDMSALERNGPTRPECAWSGDLTRCDMTHPNERCHKGANGKRATQMCTRHSGGQNLAKLIREPSNEMARLERVWSGDLTLHDTVRLTAVGGTH